VDLRVKLCNGELESPALRFTSALFCVPETYLNVLGRNTGRVQYDGRNKDDPHGISWQRVAMTQPRAKLRRLLC
jgi:hypothetical protein